MHACWVLLAVAGEMPARLLHVRPPTFVTKERPTVSEVDLTAKEFPTVRTRFGVVESIAHITASSAVAVQQFGIVVDHPSMGKASETVGALETMEDDRQVIATLTALADGPRDHAGVAAPLLGRKAQDRAAGKNRDDDNEPEPAKQP